MVYVRDIDGVDAGFDPAEPRNERGEWTKAGMVAHKKEQFYKTVSRRLVSSGALHDAYYEYLQMQYDSYHAEQLRRAFPKQGTFKEQIKHIEEQVYYAPSVEEIITRAKEIDTYRNQEFKLSLMRAMQDEKNFWFWHGTTTSAKESIKKNGLVPGAGKGADLYAEQHGNSVGQFTIGKRKTSVFMAPSLERPWDAPGVIDFAEMATEVSGGKPIILKITIPKSEKKHLHFDERLAGGIRYEGKIPPEWIEFKDLSNLGVGRVEEIPELVRDADGDVVIYGVIICKPEKSEEFEVAKDGSSYDANFNPNEPRDWHGRWSQFAEEAKKSYLEKHPKTHAETVELLEEFNEWVEDAYYFRNEKDWYARHKPLAKKLFRDKEPIFEKIIAATSINDEVPANLHNAVLAMEYYLTHNDSFKGYRRGMRLVKGKLKEITELGEVVGPKITPFSKNLQGDWDAVTVDRWMRRLFFKNPIEGGGKRSEVQNEIVRDAVISMAKSIGWKPAELQAVLWNASRYHGGDFNFNLEDFGKHLKNEANGIRAFLDKHGIAHDAAPLSEATVALAKMFLDLLDKAILLFEKIREETNENSFEVAKDGSAYDANFNPAEPRDWHGRWSEGVHGSHTSKGAYVAAKREIKESPHAILSGVGELSNHVTLSNLDDLSDELYRDAKKEFAATDTKQLTSKGQAATQGILEAFNELQKIGLYKPGDAKGVRFIFADFDESKKGVAMMTGHDPFSEAYPHDWVVNTSGFDFAVQKIRAHDIINYPQVMAAKIQDGQAGGFPIQRVADETILREYYKGCMEHEYAHFLDNKVHGRYSQMLLKALNKGIGVSAYPYGASEEAKFLGAIQRDISTYAAAVIPEETFAEGFCRWLNDPHLAPYLKEFFDFNFGKMNKWDRESMKKQLQEAEREFMPVKDGAPKYFEPYPNPKYLDKDGHVIPDRNFAKPTHDEWVRAAGLALIAPDGNMLFVKRNNHSDYPGHWAFPGGKINPGETPEQAAERETIEEIGHVSTGPYEVAIRTGGFQTFVSPVRSVFDPQWLSEHSDYKWSLPSYPPEPLHPGVREALKKMQMTADAGFNPSEPRDSHGRWTRGGTEKLGNEPEEDDWRINQLNEQEVDRYTEQEVKDTIESDFPNMHNYEVVGQPDHEYNCIAWAFGFEDKWWNPGGYVTSEIDEVLVGDYNADIYQAGSFKLKKIIDEKPAKGHVKLALFEHGGRFCHMTRQLPDGRWTSKFGGNGKTVQNDLTEMEGGMYGEITRIYDMPIKEFSRFRKEHRHGGESSWLRSDA